MSIHETIDYQILLDAATNYIVAHAIGRRTGRAAAGLGRRFAEPTTPASRAHRDA